MGKLISSENSLNQHIKNKHAELWETIKQKSEQIIDYGLSSDKKKEDMVLEDSSINRNNRYGSEDISIRFQTED